MSDPDRLTSRDDTASALDKQGLILRIIGLLFSPHSSGIRSWLPRCLDTLSEPRARCELGKRPIVGRSLHRDTISLAGTPRSDCLPAFR
jgi:hypothetical protein